MGDWDGNETDTPGIVRSGTWYLRNSNSAGVADLAFPYGLASDIPIVGDWNSDFVDTVGVVRTGLWLLRNTNTAGPADLSFLYGAATDRPLVWR